MLMLREACGLTRSLQHCWGAGSRAPKYSERALLSNQETLPSFYNVPGQIRDNLPSCEAAAADGRARAEGGGGATNLLALIASPLCCRRQEDSISMALPLPGQTASEHEARSEARSEAHTTHAAKRKQSKKKKKRTKLTEST